MAFNRLKNCDKSDMALWARGAPAQNFIEEVTGLRDIAMRKLVNTPTEEYAQRVKAYEKILSMFSEAAAMK